MEADTYTEAMKNRLAALSGEVARYFFSNWEQCPACGPKRPDLCDYHDGMLEGLVEAAAEIKHWRANHDEMVERNSILRARADSGQLDVLKAIVGILDSIENQSKGELNHGDDHMR